MLKKFAVVLLAGLLLLAGCSNSVPQSDVEAEIVREGELALGETVSAECPGNLPAEVGAEMTCVMTIESTGERWEVFIEVDRVADNTAHFTMELGEEPLSD